jgi:hypothetical protein
MSHKENETMENRSENRRLNNASIIFSPFSTQNWCPHQAEVGNFSSSGMFFMSNRPLPKGATIYIRTENNPSSEKNCNGDWAQLRTITLAQVKWCKPVAENSPFRFGIGVKYI